MIAAEGGNAVAASYDVTSPAQCAAVAQDAVSRWGRLVCLDNNVGIGSQGTIVEETEENWERVMHVNVDTMFLACKHAIPAMIRTAGGGAIVNVSSISALRPRGLTAYTVSKGAVIRYSPRRSRSITARTASAPIVWPPDRFTRPWSTLGA
jgi:NAD(P)-dependent dehydrogenase (short-subunit alcohol dehydrogenase family)